MIFLLALLLLQGVWPRWFPINTSTVTLNWAYDWSLVGNTADHFLVGVVCTDAYVKLVTNDTGKAPSCLAASDGKSYLFAARIDKPANAPQEPLNFSATLELHPPFTSTTFFVMGCLATNANGDETCGTPTTVTQTIHADQIGAAAVLPNPAGGLNLKIADLLRFKRFR